MLDQRHAGAAESRAGHAGAEHARVGLQVRDEPVDGFDRDLVVVAQARMRGVHQTSDLAVHPHPGRRDGTPWRGDWASSFAWLKRRGPFGHVPGGPPLDETFDRVIPSHVIAGCNLLDVQARVHAGLVVGWVHEPVAIAVERNYGKGRLVASTCRMLRDPPEHDPTATVLLDGLIAARQERSPRR